MAEADPRATLERLIRDRGEDYAGLSRLIGRNAATDEARLGRIAFDPSWLRRLGLGDGKSLSLIRVQGDSMVPTLSDGDEILVDRADAASRLRDGNYVLRIEDALVVKRLALSPVGARVSISSDNDAYPGWPDCELASIDLVGRVVWVGRRLG